MAARSEAAVVAESAAAPFSEAPAVPMAASTWVVPPAVGELWGSFEAWVALVAEAREGGKVLFRMMPAVLASSSSSVEAWTGPVLGLACGGDVVVGSFVGSLTVGHLDDDLLRM